MNKTTSVNIGGSNYFIEEEAYARLSAYLQSVKGHFAGSADREEIVSDIENRIAEKFSEKANGRNDAVVAKNDVEEVIAQLGQPDDIGDASAAGTQESVPAGDAAVPARKALAGLDSALPLDVLSDRIDAWIASQKASGR